MFEEAEGQDTGAAAGGNTDSVAAGIAVGRASSAVDEEVTTFLRDQRGLIGDQRKLVTLQAEELSHEMKLRHSSMWVRHASGLLKLTLEVSAVFLALAVVCGVGVIVWNAAHADGLVIEEFSVPPELASRGITGQVVASQMLDKLTAMQNETIAASAAQQLTNSWGNNINVQIPDTGVSLGEVYRFLRGWLGHETHLSGEVYRTESGIAITARTGGDSGATFTGSEADLDSLIQKTAEGV